MRLRRLLIANRGEVAVRVARAAAELGIETVAVHGTDDGDGLALRLAGAVEALPGSGPRAYLDVDALVAAARRSGCDAVHPGWGFLSEHAGFARACRDAGLVFVGPRPEVLELFGDKARARRLAAASGVPVLAGTDGPTSLEEAEAVLASLGEGGALMVKALAGGGGRGMRAVHRPGELAAAYERCRSEAEAAFGRGDVYVEQLLTRARHVEVQVVGDATGAVTHLGTRECSLQRRHQKLAEIAPAPGLAPGLRARLHDAAVRIAEAAGVDNLATVELLVDASGAPDADDGTAFAFLEVNPRLQVEHTVTEEVHGIDLVATQLRLAAGARLDEVGLAPPAAAGGAPPRGVALQVRVNAETVDPGGAVRPAAGTIRSLSLPGGPGVRVDTHAHAGMAVTGRFDPLLAKIVVHTPGAALGPVLDRARRALGELRVDGVATNAGFLANLLDHPEVRAGRAHTRFVDEHVAALAPAREAAPAGPAAAVVGAAPDDGLVRVTAPVLGTVVRVDASPGDTVAAGQQLVVLEAMKMEHVVAAPVAGTVQHVDAHLDATVAEGHLLVAIAATGEPGSAVEEAEEVDLDELRPDLAAVLERHAAGLDDARPDAVAKRHDRGQRTARENIADLVDPGSFVEYGPLVIAAQRRRRSVEDLIARTPADGLVGGLATVNGDLFGPDRARCIAMSYDYTVLAGTQGMKNHAKKDRLFELAERLRLPVVLFAEGGGGRPGDTDGSGVAGLDTMAFRLFAELSGLVPLVGIVSGRCFAGNAALLGCCDVVIGAEGSSIGMGGPAMIEGGGLGVVEPDEVGPLDVQAPNGVVDVRVADEAEAVAVAKRYLSYFQGPLAGWECADQRLLRRVIPENRLRVYDVRRVIETLADTGSVLELRRDFGPGMVTALARIEGRPVGIVANNPVHLAGAIDSTGADKAARFMQLCDAHDVPLLFLCDTPGIMVGPEAERTALVRHASRMFVTGASLTVPFFTIVLRKGYGLGAQAMAGGSFKAPLFCVAWPTGELGGMGLEGAARLGYRRELEAVEDPVEREALYQEMVDRMYEHGRALNAATYFEFDDVIDPRDSRTWILRALDSVPPAPPRTGKKRPCVDTW